MNKITTVTLREQNVSPKKARLVMNLIKNKNAVIALDILRNTDKKSAKLAYACLKSAIDSAKNKDFKEDELIIVESLAQEGRRSKRFFIRARGRSAKYLKRMSHLKISLGKAEQVKAKAKKADKKAEPKEEEKNNG